MSHRENAPRGLAAAPSSVFIIGCGDLGRRLADYWLQRGVSVGALVRRDSAAAELRGLGIHTVIGDLDQPASLRNLPLTGALLYYLAPPPGTGELDTRMRGLLEHTMEIPNRWVLISTTGVYGDCGGAWVDEQTPARPESERAKRRLDAERSLGAWASRRDTAVLILRVAGIYGPDRLPLRRLVEGAPMPVESLSPYTNRVHINDLVRVCVAAATRGESGSTYNVCDGNPSRMTHYFKAVADACGLPRPDECSPQQARQELSAGMRGYLRESRRLDNRRLLQELGVQLEYPSLELALLDVRTSPHISPGES